MSQLTTEHHLHRGLRLSEQQDWDAASWQFQLAYRRSTETIRPDVLAAWGKAVLGSSKSWEEKVRTLVVLSDTGYRHPAFWALALQAYLQVLDQYDGRDIAIPPSTRRFVEQLRGIVADCVDVGTATFRGLMDAGNQSAYAWGAALVSTGDSLYVFEGAEAGLCGRFPYRSIAETLYRPVAQSELDSLFDDPDTKRDIQQFLTARARMQLGRMSPAPSGRLPRATRSRFNPSGWTLFALRSMR